MVYGNVKGIKSSVIRQLEELAGEYEKSLFIDREVLFYVCELSVRINREICVYVTRNGQIAAIGIGNDASAPLKDLGRRRGEDRLSKIRVIHTHPDGNGRLSQTDMSALASLRLDCIAAVGVTRDGITDMEVGYIGAEGDEKVYYKSALDMDDDKLLERIFRSESGYAAQKRAVEKGKAVLVAVGDFGTTEMDELQSLASTADIKTAARVVQGKSRPDKTYCIGSGKLEELKHIVQNTSAEYVIFNNTLTGSQLNNLETALGVKVIDRPMLILEIFARHATSNEGKLQVELAMMQYTLPKIMGMGTELSRIGGGSGSSFTRGAGETKLETDRRHIRRTIFELSEKIEKLKKERDLRRNRRIKSGIKTVAIVGYTNAGKSTLMNALTKAGVKEEDKLFATLDPVTRKVFCDIGQEYLLTDTVGFIDNLPHEFVKAFKSTLEEAVYADLLLHVVDASSKDVTRQVGAVEKVLAELGAGDKPVITVLNKSDKPSAVGFDAADAVRISALTGDGLDVLREKIREKLFGKTEK